MNTLLDSGLRLSGTALLDVRPRFAQQRAELEELRRRYESLTPREREVMAGVVDGLLNKQIASDLGTTEITVKVQRAQVMKKMNAESLAGLVKIGVRLGLSPPGSSPAWPQPSRQ